MKLKNLSPITPLQNQKFVSYKSGAEQLLGLKTQQISSEYITKIHNGIPFLNASRPHDEQLKLLMFHIMLHFLTVQFFFRIIEKQDYTNLSIIYKKIGNLL